MLKLVGKNTQMLPKCWFNKWSFTMVESKKSLQANKGLLSNQYESILLGDASQFDHVGRVIILIAAAPLTKNLPLILIP